MKEMAVAVVGLGAIGSKVASALAKGIEGLRLHSVADKEPVNSTIREFAARLQSPIIPSEKAADDVDMIVDCASSSSFTEIAVPAVEKGRVLVTVNSAALLGHTDLISKARMTGARIIVPSGALLGLDAVRAAAEGTIYSAKIVTRKPPRSLAGAPLVIERNIDIERLDRPILLFHGSAREAARNFPQNVNVAASLSLAGIGADRTQSEVWADPGCTRNTHTVEVESDAGSFSMTISSAPDPQSPRTSIMAPQSVIACLRGLVCSFRVGS